MFDLRSRSVPAPSACRADPLSVVERELEGAWLGWLADHESTPVLPGDVLELIASVDPGRLTPAGRLAVLRLSERALGVVAAAQVRLIATISTDAQASAAAGDGVWAEAAGEPVDQPERELVAVALRLAPRTASERVELATDLMSRLPVLVEEMAAGRIGYQHARVISEETLNLEPAVARQVAQEVVPLARCAAVGRVRRRAAVLAARRDPHLAGRHERARECRRVFVEPEPDGMAVFGVITDQITARRLFDTIDQVAHHLQCPGELIDQVRADTLTDLILGTGHNPAAPGGGSPARIAVHTDLPTLLGLADTPGIVPGLGPVPAELVRAIASDAKWIRFLHDDTGQLITTGRYTYRPSPPLAAFIRARDGHCQFPHCTQPAARCDLDHIQPFNHTTPEHGGTTTADNLHALCRRHHRLKTIGIWHITRQPDGTSTWTTPTNHTETVHPPPPF